MDESGRCDNDYLPDHLLLVKQEKPGVNSLEGKGQGGRGAIVHSRDETTCLLN